MSGELIQTFLGLYALLLPHALFSLLRTKYVVMDHLGSHAPALSPLCCC